MRVLFVVGLLLLSASTVLAEEVTIALWNGQELFNRRAVDDQREDIERFFREIKPDVFVIDEVCSHKVVVEVAKIMKRVNDTEFLHVACSDFVQDDYEEHSSFEVGIISKYPLSKVVEYDVTPDNQPYGRENEPNERPLNADSLLKLGLDKARPSRGFLWARIDDLKITICATHLKSSRSGVELENAMKREYVTAAMALSVNEDKRILPGYSQLVIGDLNVGATDDDKNGVDLDVDVEDEDEEGDRFDETHALLSEGIVGGLRMKNLTKDVGETYDSTRFPGSGPIDNIYVTGQHESAFSAGEKSDSTFGSDHFAVWTKYTTPE